MSLGGRSRRATAPTARRHRLAPAPSWSTGACDMSGSFSSLNTALTALRYNGSPSTSRPTTSRTPTPRATPAAAWWGVARRLGGAGDVVALPERRRRRDRRRCRRGRPARRRLPRRPGPHASTGASSYLDVRAGVLQRVESALGEPGDDRGLRRPRRPSAAAGTTSPTTPASDAARGQVLGPRRRPRRRRARPGRQPRHRGGRPSAAACWRPSPRPTPSPRSWPPPTRPSPPRRSTASTPATCSTSATSSRCAWPS